MSELTPLVPPRRLTPVDYRIQHARTRINLAAVHLIRAELTWRQLEHIHMLLDRAERFHVESTTNGGKP